MLNKLTVRELATWLHNTYEEISKRLAWQTQKKCQVEFEDLPEKNKEVMMLVSAKIITEIDLIQKQTVEECKRKLNDVLQKEGEQ